MNEPNDVIVIPWPSSVRCEMMTKTHSVTSLVEDNVAEACARLFDKNAIQPCKKLLIRVEHRDMDNALQTGTTKKYV